MPTVFFFAVAELSTGPGSGVPAAAALGSITSKAEKDEEGIWLPSPYPAGFRDARGAVRPAQPGQQGVGAETSVRYASGGGARSLVRAVGGEWQNDNAQISISYFEWKSGTRTRARTFRHAPPPPVALPCPQRAAQASGAWREDALCDGCLRLFLERFSFSDGDAANDGVAQGGRGLTGWRNVRCGGCGWVWVSGAEILVREAVITFYASCQMSQIA